jgi:hypothetical protein
MANRLLMSKHNVPDRSNRMSSPRLDIFKEDLGGNPVWVAAAVDLDSARRRVSQLAPVSPGEYFVFDQKTCQIVGRLGLNRIDWT